MNSGPRSRGIVVETHWLSVLRPRLDEPTPNETSQPRQADLRDVDGPNRCEIIISPVAQAEPEGLRQMARSQFMLPDRRLRLRVNGAKFKVRLP